MHFIGNISAGSPAPGENMPKIIKILLIEDETELDTLATALAAEGYAITPAVDGEAAIRLLDAGEKYDLVLTDFAMPRATGMEVLAYVRARIGVTAPDGVKVYA
jgi:CheY-like chemotaxis protein